jgi:uncharacterized protein (TIGR00266 family)
MTVEWKVDHGPAYSVLKVWLDPGEEVWAEPGAFLLGRGRFSVETKTGGILRGLLRAVAGGESFFLNRYRAEGSAELWFAPGSPGDIAGISLDGEWLIQDTSYLAHYGDIDVSVAWRGLRGLIAEGELVWLKASGRGTVWVSSYGAIERIEVPPGEVVTIDNFHFVAMPADVDYEIGKIGGLKTFVFGGEGLVVRVRGPAQIYVQTRILPPFASLIAKYIPRRR